MIREDVIPVLKSPDRIRSPVGYHSKPTAESTDDELEQCSLLYSDHYGVYSEIEGIDRFLRRQPLGCIWADGSVPRDCRYGTLVRKVMV